MPVTANDFLLSRGTATHNLDYTPATLTLSTQIGTSYKPYLDSGDTNQSMTLDSDTGPTGIPATNRYFFLSVWLKIGAAGVWFPYQNNATPGIAISAFSSGLVRFQDASLNNAILDFAFDASGAVVNPGLNNLIVSCDTVGETYEAVLNGTALSPSGAPHNVTTSFTCDNSGGLYLIQPDDPADTFTECWFDMPGSYKSANTNKALFYNAGNPVDPGTNGAVPFGSQPVGYFTIRDSSPPPPGSTGHFFHIVPGGLIAMRGAKAILDNPITRRRDLLRSIINP